MKYEKAEVNIIEFEKVDIITSSAGDNEVDFDPSSLGSIQEPDNLKLKQVL